MQITTDQIGQADAIVQNLISTWGKVKPVVGGWFGVDKNSLTKGFGFVFSGVDQLVNFANTLEAPGVDKKTLVLGAANTLFDGIVGPLLPTWAKPFLPVLNNIIDSILDNLIEYILNKVVVPAQKAKA
jgi:hypothetical protein